MPGVTTSTDDTLRSSEALAFERIADDLLGAMGTLRRTVRRQAHRPAELAALTGAQLELVRLVRRRPGVSVAQAAAELSLAPNTVSTLVRQLSDLSYLVRRVDPLDRRVARLELSDDLGQKVVAFRDRRVAALADAMSTLPTAEQRRLRSTVGVLLKLNRAMESADAGHGH
jgi:DNA-binding MarR family transcriptional regulator